ncbi:MAG: hypothetical protein ACYC5R_07770, partial [Melioribacteraceae bacterium]
MLRLFFNDVYFPIDSQPNGVAANRFTYRRYIGVNLILALIDRNLFYQYGIHKDNLESFVFLLIQ